jgi:hypothetical protein
MIRDRCEGDHRIALLAILVALGVACNPAPPPKPRLIVLYATCTVNKDFLAPYSDGIDFTPNFARFGHEAAVFTSHQTEAGISGPAFASIYSGAQADRHGVFKHPKKLNDDLYLIFEAFADRLRSLLLDCTRDVATRPQLRAGGRRSEHHPGSPDR